MDTHSDLVIEISADHGDLQIQPTTLHTNGNRLIMENHKSVHLRIHHWHGLAPLDHLTLTGPQAVPAAPVTTDRCHRSKVDEDAKKEESDHRLLLNHKNLDNQTCLTGHASTSKAAFKDYGVTTQQSSSNNFANYTFDGFTQGNRRCVSSLRRLAWTPYD